MYSGKILHDLWMSATQEHRTAVSNCRLTENGYQQGPESSCEIGHWSMGRDDKNLEQR